MAEQPLKFRGLSLLRRVNELLCETPSPSLHEVSTAMSAFCATVALSAKWPHSLKDKAAEIRQMVTTEGAAILDLADPKTLGDLKERLCNFIDEVEIFVLQDYPGD